MPRKKLCLIDAYSQIFRAYHALPALTTSSGLPTNAAYGFTTMLRKLLQEEKPAYCAAVFDTPGRTVRHEEFEGYKASRPPTPDDLLTQIPYIKKICEAFRIPVLELSEYEADDVIGTLARRADREGIETMIVSEDKDLLQLVTDRVKLLTERNRRRVYDPEAVMERFGVPPERVPDLLGLMGDTVDDIPGVPGIGPKRAREILERYGSLEDAIDHADDLARYKYGRNLAEFADQARLSKRLATVHTELDLEVPLEDMAVREPDNATVRALFIELEFRRLVDDYVDEPVERHVEARTLTTPEELAAALGDAGKAGRLTIELFTDSVEPMRARIVGIGLCWDARSACYVPVGHQGLEAADTMRLDVVLELLGPVLQDEGVDLVGHDVKHEAVVLRRHGVRPRRVRFDTMLCSYVLHPTRQGHDLATVAADVLAVRLPQLKDIIPARGDGLAEVPIAEATAYAAQHTGAVLALADALGPELAAQESLSRLYHEIEMPLADVLAAMEFRGVRIDVEYLRQMSSELAADLERLEGLIFEAAGEPFNLNSPKQLAEILFDRLELPVGKRTAKTGNRSTRAEVLEALAQDHPIAANILEYRELSKLRSTYLEALPERVDPETGRIHGSFDQAVAATGRLSSSNPNLQNIPVRTALGRKIRKAFIPADGCALVVADYSQIELRIMAHLSGDPGLRAAFTEGFDIHRATAAEIFGVASDEVTSQQRDRAKVINFGVLYGMGPQRLAREFGISTKEARAFIDRYLDAYAGVRDFLARTVEDAKRDGFVTTLLGRVRHLPELQSSRPMVRAFGERIAVNTPLQGTAADLIKLAMVNLHSRLPSLSEQAAILIQVHDELVLEVPERDLDDVVPAVRQEMEEAIELEVPLEVEIGIGTDWMNAKA